MHDDIAVPSTSPAADATQAFDASFAQRGLWILDQFDQAPGLYNIPAVWRLRGALRVDALEQGLAEIVQRHEVLRTSLAQVEGRLCQMIHDAAPVTLERFDLPDDGDRASRAREIAERHATLPFDLGRAPLVRAGLVRIAQDDHVFVLTLHHIVADAWSVGVLMRELAALYTAFAAGAASPLPALEIQYADYAVWQRDWLRGDVLAEQLAYWTRTLRGAPAGLALPANRQRPPVMSHRGETLPFELERETVAGLRHLARESRATLFMVFAAALAALLHRWTGQDDLSIGYPVANRGEAQTESLLGLFTNTLVLRTRPRPQADFASLLGAVRESVLDADAHQQVPFEKVVEALQPERRLGESPLFQVMLSLDNTGLERLRLGDLRIEPLPGAGGTAKFDLSVDLLEDGERVRGEIEYATDLFDRATIERLARCWRCLLEAVAVSPGLPLDRLPLLELGAPLLPPDAASTSAAPAPFEPLLARVARIAKEAPEAPAVVDGSRTCTRAELAARAHRLAHRLQALGVRPGERVGLFADPGLERVVGELGVLETGAACVVLDPRDAPEALALTLHDSHARRLVASAALRARAPACAATLVIDESGPAPSDAGGLGRAARPGEVAYVLPRPGPDGQPQGLIISHAAAAGECAAQAVDAGSRVLVVGHAGDLLCHRLALAALARGATLLTVAADAVVGAEWLREARPSVVGGAAQACARLLRDAPTPGLRHVLIDDAPFDADLGVRLLAGGVEVQRLDSVHAALQQRWAADGAGAAAARVVAGMRVHVLDAGCAPVPAGVVGEIHLAGAGLADGVDALPGATAAAWRPDPFGRPGARMLATGERGRCRPDGSVERLGRIDGLVSLQGRLVDTAVVQAALRAAPGVAEVVVVASSTPADDAGLLACVVAKGDGSVGADALREHLLRQLPPSMLPSRWRFLEGLPRHANGEIDRAGLAELASAGSAGVPAAPVAPRNELEATLASLWADLLKVPQVGVHDNFFSLGGHSLLAVRLVATLRAGSGVDLSLQEVFQAPTVAALAALLGSRRGAANAAGVPLPDGAASAWAVGRPSFGQEDILRDLVDDAIPGDELHGIRAAWRVVGPLDLARLQAAFDHVLQRHDALRSAFVTGPDGWQMHVHEQVRLPFAVEDLRDIAADPRAVQARVMAALYEPIDIAQAPLMRVHVARLGDGDIVLALAVSHLVFDGESDDVFWDEAVRLYDAPVHEWPSLLGEPPLQYSAFADWQRRFMRDDPLAATQVARWRERLGDMATTLPLPCDRPRPPVFTHRGAGLSASLEDGLVRDMREQGARHGWTRYTQVMAALFATLRVETGEDDVFIVTPAGGRFASELFGSVGFYARGLVIRGQLDPLASGTTLLAQVHDRVVEALSNQHIPRCAIIDLCGPRPDRSHTARFQVHFSYVQTGGSNPRLGGLELVPQPCGTDSTYNDLRVVVAESADGVTLSLQYCRDLFEARSARRILDRLVLAVGQLCRARSQDMPLADVLARLDRDGAAALPAAIGAPS
jgi:non-ribosomal peptide synthetase component F/aryl carrier-like protein